MSGRNLLLVLIAVAALALVVWVASERSTPGAPVLSETPAVEPAPEPVEPGLPPPDRATEPSSGSPIVAAPVSSAVRGRVVDISGKAIGNIQVGVLEELDELPVSTRSNPDGSFDLQLFALPCRIVVQEPGWITVAAAVIETDAPAQTAVVVAAPSARLSGRVSDRADRALPGALLEIRTDPAVAPASNSVWTVASGAGGRFQLEAAPALPRLQLRTSLAGWRTDLRSLDLPTEAELLIVLDADEFSGPELEGTVVHADGSPAAGAFVSLGSAHTRTDARGDYRFFPGWFEARTPLVAVARSFQPAVIEGYGARIDRTARTVPRERLVLSGRALAIAGRVLSPRGEPCKGWRVVLEGGTPLDPGGFSHDLAEEQAGGRSDSRTDSTGAFRIDGLCARSYTVVAVGRGRGTRRLELAVRSKPIEAGSSGLDLIAPDFAEGGAIRGRVLDGSGAPVASARVGLGRPIRPAGLGQFHIQGRMDSVSAADGSFAIEGAPDSLLRLVAIGPFGFPAALELEPGASRSSVELRVQGGREITFDGTRASPRPDTLQVVRADSDSPLVRLVDGACGPTLVADDAREIVLFRGCIELGRVPLPASTSSLTLSWP